MKATDASVLSDRLHAFVLEHGGHVEQSPAPRRPRGGAHIFVSVRLSVNSSTVTVVSICVPVYLLL